MSDSAARARETDGELRAAMSRFRAVFVMIVVISAILNVLLLAGSIYMLMIYDSVLPGRSIPTLVGLLALVTLAYLFQAFFDQIRAGLLSDVGNGLDLALSRRVQSAMGQMVLNGRPPTGDGLVPMRDLDQVRSFISGTGLATMIDLPWIVFFLGILFMLHVWLGVTTLIGALILLALTLVTNRVMKQPSSQLHLLNAERNGLAETNLRHVELFAALGMRDRMRGRWEAVNDRYVALSDRVSRRGAKLGGVSKVLRLLLQSVILSVGALLVISGKASGGVIFASSVLSGRALAPVDQAIANWRNLIGARQGWARLREMLARVPVRDTGATRLPPPRDGLYVESLTVGPPGSGQTTLHGVQFRLHAGDALGLIGPSGAGKTTLARALLGLWPAQSGSVRLDGAALDQWWPEDLGAAMGYLPQTVELVAGTIAENIARFDPDATSDAVIAAARRAGVHSLITRLPMGYDTEIGDDGRQLSAGQRQRVGLARALYGDPFLVVLDEPNSNLDAEGEAALGEAIVGIRERGGIVVVIAHRPSVLGHVNKIMYLRDGQIELFGPRDQVMERISRPAAAPAEVVEPTPALEEGKQ
ncbi:type I secretion system permease/ATPase [uncultured Sphingomonas sp.]|uniref:type I secretion system permease/ATPase n=1 Tax=uncultured Sphingomonas sp. TaxID=158754 RepID=UPI0025847DA6|nr:type I secretion system permease/ATPase [uncultured Sphingomonas sp.]